MWQLVAIPKGLIYLFSFLMILALVTIGYLVGSRSASTNPHPSASTPSGQSPVHSPTRPPTKSLEERVDAIDKRVHAISQGGTERLNIAEPITPQATVPASQTVPDRRGTEERGYLTRVDALIGQRALSDTQPLGAKLLDRAMKLNPKERHSLIEQTEQVQLELERLTPPDSCAEHHGLLVEELRHAVTLLQEVTPAAESGDTNRIAALAPSSEEFQQATYRLRQLDRELRGENLP